MFDDYLVINNKLLFIQDLKSIIHGEFDMSNEGEITCLLGMKIL